MKRNNKNGVSARLGLTQKELAAALGVSRSHLGMFECGTRSLSDKVMDRLRALEHPFLLQNRQVVMEKVSRARLDLQAQNLRQRLNENAYQLRAAGVALEKLQLRHEKIANRARTIHVFDASPQEKRTGGHEVLKNLLAIETHNLLQGPLLESIINQEIKMKLLTSEMEVLKEMLEKIERELNGG